MSFLYFWWLTKKYYIHFKDENPPTRMSLITDMNLNTLNSYFNWTFENWIRCLLIRQDIALFIVTVEIRGNYCSFECRFQAIAF